MSNLDYKQDMKVDKYNLEIEWERHTSMYLDYMKAEVEAQDIKDRAERRMDLVKAEMELKIRANPKKYGIEKASEASIKGRALTSTRYQEAVEEYLVAAKRARTLLGVMKGMEHRKRQLTELDHLYTSGYYSSSRPSTEGISNARQHRQRDALKEKMTKRMDRR
jgi:hypothetical protein